MQSDSPPPPQLLEQLVPFIERGLTLARFGLRQIDGGIDRASRDLMGPEFERRLSHVKERAGAHGVDAFGMDPEWARVAIMVAAFFHRVWFRTAVRGVGNVPRQRAILVANHSGQVPLDGLVIGASMFLDADPPRIVRSMVEKWTQSLPFVSTAFQRLGQVVGVPENARRLLESEECLLVFPEGVRGISKPFTQRYQLAEFGHGFARLALETATPLVPVSVVGAEEQYISLGNMERIAKLLGVPSLPLLPQLLLPGGAMPLPVRYRLRFGEPIEAVGDPDDESAVVALADRVRTEIATMLERGTHERRSWFY